MRLIKPGWKNLRMGITPWEQVTGDTVLAVLEEYGRECYKSEDKIAPGTAAPFIALRIKQGHIALLDHLHLTARYVCDRGISHEWLRHKLTEMFGTGVRELSDNDFTPMAVCQESTRYCNYMDAGNVTFIIPPWLDLEEGHYIDSQRDCLELKRHGMFKEANFVTLCYASEHAYLEALRMWQTPQEARGMLAIATKTEFTVTCSLTEWRHVMRQRVANAAHPQMRELMRPQLLDLQAKLPVIFDDITF